MAKLYSKQQVGVADGSVKPARQADGREVNANKRTLIATKVTGTQWAVGDTVNLGKIPSGRKVVGVRVCTDTALGSATLSIGTLAAPAKYVNAKTTATTDAPALLGPSAAALALDPTTVEEELWATIGGAAIAAAVVLSIEVETAGI